MAIYPLTGIDLSDPTPGMRRELKTNRGAAGGTTPARDALLIGNKIADVGDASFDGLGEAIAFPRLITSEQDVIDRYGFGSELLLMYRAFVAANGSATSVFALSIAPGTGNGTATLTFANAATGAGAVEVSCIGEKIQVPIASGDAATAIATAVRDGINAQIAWPISASVSGAIVTVTTKIAGLRHDHHLDRLRARITRPIATTVTKSAVTPASTSDDITNALTNLASSEIYYQVCPFTATTSVSASDNGLGEHLAAINAARLPDVAKEQMLIAAAGGTAAQAATVAVSMNSEWSHLFHAEDNDFSPAMVAAHCAGAVARAQASDRAANLADFGKNQSTDLFRIPDPFDPTDRPTSVEIKTLLNAGVSPISFTSNGTPFIVDYVTTRTQTAGVTDYRARSGHIPSVITEFWQRTKARYSAVKQPKIADDPADGQKPLAGVDYPRNVRSLLSSVIDDMTADALLDPSPAAIATMKDSIDVGRLDAGFSCRAQVAAIRHNKKQWFLIEETSPAI